MSRPSLPQPVRGQLLREIDLAGNSIRETNVERINEQLTERGEDSIYYFHHDTRRLTNGHTLVLAGVERLLEDLQGPGIIDVIGDMVIDLDQDWQVVWTWNSFDHMDVSRRALRDEDCGNLVGANVCGPLRLQEDADAAHDWTHGNAVTYMPDGNLILSFRHQDWIMKVDYQDGAGSGDVIWRLGRDGDFDLIQAQPGGPHTKPWFSGQHQPLVYGTDELVVYDNANALNEPEPTGAESRGQVYKLDEDETPPTATLVASADLGVFSPFLGSAQKLSNGNYHFLSGAIPRDEPSILPDILSRMSQSTETDPEGNIISILEADTTTYRSFRMRSMYEMATPVPREEESRRE